MKLTRVNVFLILTITYAILIFYLSSISDLRLPRTGTLLLNELIRIIQHNDYVFLLAPFSPLLLQRDKLLHIMLYFGFGLLLHLTLRSADKSRVMAVMLAISLGALYGASDEFHQMFVAGRSASTLDLAADVTGIFFAQIVIFTIYCIKVVLTRIH